jgi:hypothetical protein
MQIEIDGISAGKQLVRVSVPFEPQSLKAGDGLEVQSGDFHADADVRVLTCYPPPASGRPQYVRRAMVTFLYDAPRAGAVPFSFRPSGPAVSHEPELPVQVDVKGETLHVTAEGLEVEAKPVAPTRARPTADRRGRIRSIDAGPEYVESSRLYLWRRFAFRDPKWPRMIEVRQDGVGRVVVVCHLQRIAKDEGYAPDFGWEISVLHPGHGTWRISQPSAPFKHRGGPGAVRSSWPAEGTRELLTCAASDRVPMQPYSWRRSEFVLDPGLRPLSPTLQETYVARIPGRTEETKLPKPLQDALAYHRQAVPRMTAVGDDWGNVTGYSDASPHGGVFGMNRLNHCMSIFEDGRAVGSRELLDTGVAWCDNFYDQTIWWGPGQTGGTRYNNVSAQNKRPPDTSYMWRSNDSVSFCTKGFAAFLLAYEQTGDPLMLEALHSQVVYCEKYVDAGPNYCRNVGIVRDYLDLYRMVGGRQYVDDALKLFRDLRPLLSTGGLFAEQGKPLEADPPFIDDDQQGYRHPFAKPYILGYALEGLPELSLLAPGEPGLKETVRAVANFMAISQDPIGGWRYPHPLSSLVMTGQAIEHAWQLVQADRALGPVPEHLDAIERALRQRILFWQRSGRMLNVLRGWEISTGKIKTSSEIYELYRHPKDRPRDRDYTEGALGLGGNAPEGIVYFPEVLAYYLQHRPAARLLEAPPAGSPLAQALARTPASERTGR